MSLLLQSNVLKKQLSVKVVIVNAIFAQGNKFQDSTY